MGHSETIDRINLKQILQQKAPSVARKIPNFVVNYLIKTIHQEELNDILTRYHDKQGVDFMNELISYFDLTIKLEDEENIPNDGRFIFASNHPLGGLDGICLSAIIGSKFDGKIKYPVNDLLLYLPNLRSIFIPVNKHGAQDRSAALKMEEAYSSDNQMITFPAGLCSRRIKGQILDLEWKKSFIQKAVEHKRDIIPVYFDARNSSFFYGLSNLRKALGVKANIEMLYLSDEMFKQKHKTFKVYFGEPIPWQTFDNSKKPAEWAKWVKERAYKLVK